MKIPQVTFAIAAALLVTSCGRPVESAVSGSWLLEAVDGDFVPIVLATVPELKIIREGLLLLYPDGKYTYDHWIEAREGPRVRAAGTSAEGTWVRDGDDVHLTDRATGATSFGTVYGTALRVVFGKEIHDFRLVLNDPTLWQKGGT